MPYVWTKHAIRQARCLPYVWHAWWIACVVAVCITHAFTKDKAGNRVVAECLHALLPNASDALSKKLSYLMHASFTHVTWPIQTSISHCYIDQSCDSFDVWHTVWTCVTILVDTRVYVFHGCDTTISFHGCVTEAEAVSCSCRHKDVSSW